jgi:hypothetical protein
LVDPLRTDLADGTRPVLAPTAEVGLMPEDARAAIDADLAPAGGENERNSGVLGTGFTWIDLTATPFLADETTLLTATPGTTFSLESGTLADGERALRGAALPKAGVGAVKLPIQGPGRMAAGSTGI